MKYHGNNPVGLAISNDTKGEVRDQVLRILDEYRQSAEQNSSSSALPAAYQRNLAAAECAVVCAEVVKEFHAVCVSASAEQAR
jgi:hypothetical protein